MLAQLFAYAFVGGFTAIVVFGHLRLAMELLAGERHAGRSVGASLRPFASA